MKLGIIAKGFKKSDLEYIKNKGLDFVEYCVNYTPDAPNRHKEFVDAITEIKSGLSDYGLFVGSVGRWGGVKLTEYGAINEEELATEKQLIDAVAELGCSVYVTGCNYIESISLFENYSAAISYFEKLIEYGKAKNVKIATYNCRWANFVNSDPAWSVIHGHLPDLYIKYDPSHSIYDGGDYLSEIKKWGHRFAHFHLKGSLLIDGERYDDPPAGLDGTDWKSVMAALYTLGYDGTLGIEPHSATWRGEIGEKGIDYTIDYFRKMIF